MRPFPGLVVPACTSWVAMVSPGQLVVLAHTSHKPLPGIVRIHEVVVEDEEMQHDDVAGCVVVVVEASQPLLLAWEEANFREAEGAVTEPKVVEAEVAVQDLQQAMVVVVVEIQKKPQLVVEVVGAKCPVQVVAVGVEKSTTVEIEVPS